jgi:hypothetical protein
MENQKAWEIAIWFAEGFVEAYRNGELRRENAENYIQDVTKYLEPANARNMYIGECMIQIRTILPKPFRRGRKGLPIFIRKYACELFAYVRKHEKLPVFSRKGEKSAYQRVAEAFHKIGLREVTEFSVKEWWYSYRYQ